MYNLILVNLLSYNNTMCTVFTCDNFGHEKRLDPRKNELNSLSIEDTVPLQGTWFLQNKTNKQTPKTLVIYLATNCSSYYCKAVQ